MICSFGGLLSLLGKGFVLLKQPILFLDFLLPDPVSLQSTKCTH